MSPVEGGRLCGQCDKVIYDFTNMKWKEISALQIEHGNSLCGMYRAKQLKHWGHEPPSALNSCKSAVASLGLLLASSGVIHSQTASTITLSGNVTEVEFGEPMIYANVMVFSKDRSYFEGAVTDFNGNFSIDLDTSSAGIEDMYMEFSHMGYRTVRVDSITPQRPINVVFDSQDVVMDVFYVSKPSFWQRMGAPFRRWFGKK